MPLEQHERETETSGASSSTTYTLPYRTDFSTTNNSELRIRMQTLVESIERCTKSDDRNLLLGNLQGMVECILLKSEDFPELLFKFGKLEALYEIAQNELFVLNACIDARSYICRLESSIFPRWLIISKNIPRQMKWQIAVQFDLSVDLRKIHMRLDELSLSVARLSAIIVRVCGEVPGLVHNPKPMPSMNANQWNEFCASLNINNEDDKKCMHVILAPLSTVHTRIATAKNKEVREVKNSFELHNFVLEILINIKSNLVFTEESVFKLFKDMDVCIDSVIVPRNKKTAYALLKNNKWETVNQLEADLEKQVDIFQVSTHLSFGYPFQ